MIHWWPKEKTVGRALGGAAGNRLVKEKAIARQLCAAEGREHVYGFRPSCHGVQKPERGTVSSDPLPAPTGGSDQQWREARRGELRGTSHAHSSSHMASVVSGRTADKPGSVEGAEDKSSRVEGDR